MPQAPAICDTCSTVFPSGFAFGGSVRGVTMIGNTSGPCPNCGGMGTVPDGVYETIGETLKILATNASSNQSLQRLATILQGLNRPGVSGQAVAAAIAEKAPEFKALAAAARRPSGVDVKWWVMFVLAAIAVILQGWGDFAPRDTGATPDQIEHIYEQVLRHAQPPPTGTPVPITSGRQSRNSLCYCGSGKKYKRCHGQGAPAASSVGPEHRSRA